MKVCDDCLKEQGVMDVKLTPDDEITVIYVEGEEFPLTLCRLHAARREAA